MERHVRNSKPLEEFRWPNKSYEMKFSHKDSEYLVKTGEDSENVPTVVIVGRLDDGLELCDDGKYCEMVSYLDRIDDAKKEEIRLAMDDVFEQETVRIIVR